jgi:hypothetical protein
MPGLIEREILLAPDLVARATAAAMSGLVQKWMLSQPRPVRRSYVREVLDAGGGELEQEIWMLRQPDAVRSSYLQDVVRVQGSGPQVEWMLRQPDAVRESYVREVLERRGAGR